MTILYADDPADAEGWAQAIRALDPGAQIRFWPDTGPVADIDFAIVGSHAPGDLRVFPNLKAIQSTWAGVNHLLADDNLPHATPLARMVDQGLTVSMTEYIVFHVLDTLREGPRLRAAQARAVWLDLAPRAPRDLVVAIMGLGVLGQDAAARLIDLGFPVRGWSRSPRAVPGVETFAGRERLDACLDGADILVCLLPLTDDTRGILDARVFAALKPGAVLIHAARGAHLVEADLTAALDRGHLSRAVVDVFAAEPLPQDHPFWRDGRITVTPHVAAISRAGIGAPAIVENRRRALAGEPLVNQVDRGRGY